jgi:hypothetical protein
VYAVADPERLEQIHVGNTAIKKIHRPPTAANRRTDRLQSVDGDYLVDRCGYLQSVENHGRSLAKENLFAKGA